MLESAWTDSVKEGFFLSNSNIGWKSIFRLLDSKAAVLPKFQNLLEGLVRP